MKINISNLNFSYSKASSLLLDNFSFDVKNGERICLKGDSGTGKSTLFRLLLGFEKPLAGQILVDGQPLVGKLLHDFRSRSAWLPQDLNLGEGSVKTLFFYPFIFKANQKKRPKETEVQQVFDFLGLQDLKWEQTFGSLSTGQRQRLGIALCHFLDKEILLLDEPTSALDATSKEKVKELIFDETKIIISASHDDWWLAQATKIVELHPKKI